MDTQRFRRGAPPIGVWAVVVLAGLAALAGCKQSSTGGGVTPNVTINIVPGAFNKGMAAFSPSKATARVGNLVRLHNGDSITHSIQTVTAGGPTWGMISANTNRDVTVTTVGRFEYKCVIGGHIMSDTLVVDP